jgi:tyrosine-protein phosphatase YwqE
MRNIKSSTDAAAPGLATLALQLIFVKTPTQPVFSFFKKKPRLAASLEGIGCDIHSHLIPGIDDGSPNLETSMLLIRGLIDLGYRKVITTPHVNNDRFQNTPEIILGGRDRVIQEIRRQGLAVEFGAAAEYLIDDGFMDKLARSESFAAPLASAASAPQHGSPSSTFAPLPQQDVPSSAPREGSPSSTSALPPQQGTPSSAAAQNGPSHLPVFLPLKDNLLLVELSFFVPAINLKQVLFDLQLKGYQPVLAHPERYLYFAANKGWYDQLREIGCLFQLNLLSFNGHYGREVRALAEYLVKKRYVDFLGTDMHHPGHLELLRHSSAIYKAVQQIIDLGLLKNPSL